MKRTLLLSNDRAVSSLHHGKLSKSQRAEARPAAIYYQGKDGRRKFRGDKRLKDSQCLDEFYIPEGPEDLYCDPI